jgi:hypothetical protein
MPTLWLILRGGFLRAKRAEMLGLAAGLCGLITTVAQWAVGDRSILSLLHALVKNWTLIAGGFGVAGLAAKVERKKAAEDSVADIAARALRP